MTCTNKWLLALLFLSIQLICIGQVPSKETTVDKIERKLGPKSRTFVGYFTINNEYLANAIFNADDLLTEIDIVPKYYLSDDERSQRIQRLTFRQYRELVYKIDSIKPLGKLIKKGSYGLVTNAMKVPVTDQYEEAFIKRAVVQKLKGRTELVTFFSVYFIHRVEGVVEEKAAYECCGGKDKYYTVKIDGKWYYLGEQQFNKAIQNTKPLLEVAGPIK